MNKEDISAGKISKCIVNGTDITRLVTALEYFESIYSPTASCNITISDASGFHQKANLKGNEDVEIDFGNRNGSNIKMKFKTWKVTERTRVKENQDMYVLVCCSQEFITQNEKAIEKAYKNQKVSDMMKKFHEEYVKGTKTIKKDLVTNEETKGNMNYTGTGLSPIPVIRWAAKEGYSAKAKASNYLYWQDRDGYHFKTVDSMLQGKSGDTLNYAHQNVPQNSSPDKTIIAFHQQSDFDSLDSSFSGADSDHWYLWDPLTGKTAGGSKRSGSGSVNHTGKDTITPDKIETKRGEVFRMIVAPGYTAKDSKFIQSRSKTDIETKRTLPEHGANSSAALQLDNLIMNIRVPGNTKYKPGIKVKLNIPANQEEGTIDRRSGDYLITSVRHVIFRDDKDLKYDCVLECKSDAHSKKSSGKSGVNASGGVLV